MKVLLIIPVVLLFVFYMIKHPIITQDSGFISYSVMEFDSLLRQGNVQLVDVRTPSEYKEGYIQGAININVKDSSFVIKADSVLDKSIPVAVYCKGGVRSKKAAGKLVDKGYKVYNLQKGFDEWKKEGMVILSKIE